MFQSEVAYPVVSQVYRRFYQPSLTLVHFRLCGINLFPYITLNTDAAKWFKHYFQVLKMSLRIANCMSCTLEQLRLGLGVLHGLTKTPFCVDCRYADILVLMMAPRISENFICRTPVKTESDDFHF